MTRMMARCRTLRTNCTDAEGILWARLRAKRFMDLKFRRQHPCGPYILDFYCYDPSLAVELDGGQHFEANARDYDRRRTTFLERHGIRVIRFPTDLVFRDMETVLEAIRLAIIELPSP